MNSGSKYNRRAVLWPPAAADEDTLERLVELFWVNVKPRSARPMIINEEEQTVTSYTLTTPWTPRLAELASERTRIQVGRLMLEITGAIDVEDARRELSFECVESR